MPWVVNHGTWPHGIEWLLEAAAETYLPLLRMLSNLRRDGIAFNCNLNLSPILLEQLAHPIFQAEFPQYLERKIAAAREDEAFFNQTGEPHYAATARFWEQFFTLTLADFNALHGDIIAGFRAFNDAGLIEIITCGATHGYLPLLGTDESVRAQVRTAAATHQRHLGKPPRGIWSPECGYRPAGTWSFPVAAHDASPLPPPSSRIGVEQAFSESGLEFFFVDTHLVEESARVASPYEGRFAKAPPRPSASPEAVASHRLCQPYYVDGPYAAAPGEPGDKARAVTVFPRDPRTGLQVWSGDWGYPGDAAYLDFHKKRWPGGHRYWRVTGPNVDMADKQPYDPQAAAERVRSHASHFVHLLWQALEGAFDGPVPPILCSPFDAELFGHWWFEGPAWLEAVARVLHDYPVGIELISGSQYLDQYPRAGFIAMHEGSWGAEGNNHVWLNNETSWTYSHLYPAEIFTREVCSSDAWKADPLAARIVKQLCRELLLLESSDWQFLITTGAARDYAELRFTTHLDQFTELKIMWQHWSAEQNLTEGQHLRLSAIEERDSIFPDIDPTFWASGSHQAPPNSRTLSLLGNPTPRIVNESTEATDATISELPKFHSTRTP